MWAWYTVLSSSTSPSLDDVARRGSRPVQRRQRAYIIDCTVSDFREVKTKAGTFKAFKLDRSWKIRVAQGVPPTWNDAIWISPDTKGLVKFESGNRAPSFELESYKITP